MESFMHISPEGEQTGGHHGPSPEDDPGSARAALRMQGFLTLAFGFALGLALVLLFWFLQTYPPSTAVKTFVDQFNLWHVFLFGLIAGTLASGIYNLLVVRRLNLFGLESSVD